MFSFLKWRICFIVCIINIYNTLIRITWSARFKVACNFAYGMPKRKNSTEKRLKMSLVLNDLGYVQHDIAIKYLLASLSGGSR